MRLTYMEAKIFNIPLDKLREPKVLLRPVRRDTTEYLELRDSVQKSGILNAILVRPVGDAYEVVDGWHRTNALKDLRVDTAPCIIKELSDKETMVAQIEGNAIRQQMKPIEYAIQLKRILSEQDLTLLELANLINKSSSWISQQMRLLNLCDKAQDALNRGFLGVKNAYELAKLPNRTQDQLLDNAVTMSQADFKDHIAERIRRLKEASLRGNLMSRYVNEFEPAPSRRSLKEIEYERRTLKNGTRIITEEGFTMPIEAWHAALQWAVRMDRAEVEIQKVRQAIRHKKLVLEPEDTNELTDSIQDQ